MNVIYMDSFFFSSRRRHTRYWRDWSSVVCSSHLLRDIEECCDEVLILNKGRIAALCNLEEERKANLKFLELEVNNENGFVHAIHQLGCECASFGNGRLKIVLPENIQLRRIYELAAEHTVQIRR